MTNHSRRARVGGAVMSVIALGAMLAGAAPAFATGSVTITSIQGPSPLSAAVPSGVEGSLTSPSINATFTDTNAVAPSNLTVAINWGDNSTSSNQAGPNFDPNLLVTQVGGPFGTTYTVTDSHTFPEESPVSQFPVTLHVYENASPSTNTDTQTATAQVDDASLSSGLPPAVSPGTVIVGGNTGNPTTAAQAQAIFQAAIGGRDNGTAPSGQLGGFRHISWDDVTLDGTDFGGSEQTITLGHTVSLASDRMQDRGIDLTGPLAVSNDGFVDVNGSVTGLFPAFSAPNVAAPFNSNILEFDVVAPSSPATTPVPQATATRGVGAIFLNVRQPGTYIQLFDDNVLLDTLNVPTRSTGGAVFAGELFPTAQVTRVLVSLGNAQIFSFDGTTATSGGADTASNNLVAADDFTLAEPVPIRAPLSATAGVPLSGTVASFNDLDPNGNARDYAATIDWGDGGSTPGTIASDGAGGFDVSGAHTYTQRGTYTATASVADLGGSQIKLYTTVNVAPAPPPGAAPSNALTLTGVTVGKDGTLRISGQNGSAGSDAVTATASNPGKRSATTTKKRKRHRKPIRYGSGSASTTGPGPFTVQIKPSRAAAKLLKRGKTLSVSIAVTFTPTGLGPNTKSTSVAVKFKKQRKR